MSEYDEPGAWSAELTRLAGSVQPTPEAAASVRAGIKRRQSRRTALAVAGSAAAVVVVASSAFALSRPSAQDPVTPAASTSSPASPSGTPSSSPSTSPSYSIWEEPAPGDCPQYNKVFDPDAAPPILDLAAQQQLVAQLEKTRFQGFEVHRAEPTPIGVGVLVVTDDVPAARELLEREYGAAMVGGWNPHAPAPGFGIDLHTSIDQMLGWELDPVVRWVQGQARGYAGSAGIALWRDAGAVLLQWKDPVPAEIVALAGSRPNGVEVVVEGVRYSDRETLDAGRRVFDAFRSGEVEGKVSMTSGCGDQSGLVVGIPPGVLGDRKEEFERLLEPIAGMPVTVVEEEMPVALTGNPG